MLSGWCYEKEEMIEPSSYNFYEGISSIHIWKKEVTQASSFKEPTANNQKQYTMDIFKEDSIHSIGSGGSTGLYRRLHVLTSTSAHHHGAQNKQFQRRLGGRKNQTHTNEVTKILLT